MAAQCQVALMRKEMRGVDCGSACRRCSKGGRTPREYLDEWVGQTRDASMPAEKRSLAMARMEDEDESVGSMVIRMSAVS